MYAVIEAGGKQYRVQEGDVITVEKLNVEAGETVAFDKVLVLGEGKDIKVGAPYTGDVVTGSVVENGKGQKVIIFKYKAKKDYRKKQGHRQPYTMVEITGLGAIFDPNVTTLYGKSKASYPFITPITIDAKNAINDYILTEGINRAQRERASSIDMYLMGEKAFEVKFSV